MLLFAGMQLELYITLACRNRPYDHLRRAALSLGVLFIVLCRGLQTRSETVCSIRMVGIHIESMTYFGTHHRRLIPIEDIDTCVVNEAIGLSTVVFYLAILLKSKAGQSQKILVPFRRLQPRLHILLKVREFLLDRLCLTTSDATTNDVQ
eukprot:GHVO01040849.1.p2 GENE.GHVO01040849.1~~GHVO01040849.1.p2  ORF type:complete len:150 (+),score=8.40 GHVO01040849.1:111-560(+)